MTTNAITLEFSHTTKGKRLLLFGGYIYTLNKDRGRVKYWRCRDRPCKAFVRTDGDDNYKNHSGSHDGHLPSPEQIELLKFKKQVKERVIKESTPIAHIYEQELANANLSQISLALAPEAKDARKDKILMKFSFLFTLIKTSEPSLCRLRRKTTPILPTSSDCDIPLTYRQTLDGKEFLFKDSMIRGKRELIFANEKQLLTLFESKHIFIDGTFSVCPPFFDQVLTIHGIHHEHGEFLLMFLLYKFTFPFEVVPCVIAVLPGRSSTFYNHLFQLLDEYAASLHMSFEPDLITTDFENGLIKSIKHHVSCILKVLGFSITSF